MRSLFWKGFTVKETAIQRLARRLPRWISPNLLTTLRILLAIPVVILLRQDTNAWALVVFLFAFVLDFFDGPLARAQNRVTDFGKLYDPFADKVAFLAVLVAEGYARLPHGLFWTIIVLETFLVLLAVSLKPLMNRRNVNRALGANIFGKIKMSTQVIGVVILLIGWTDATGQAVVEIVFWIAIGLAVLSIIGHLTMPTGKDPSQGSDPALDEEL